MAEASKLFSNALESTRTPVEGARAIVEGYGLSYNDTTLEDIQEIIKRLDQLYDDASELMAKHDQWFGQSG